MERRQLEYFLAVASHRSFTSAARTLLVAQPSLSHSIRLLEREPGTPLFHHLGRGVALTSAGEAFVAPARQIMRDMETARSVVHSIAGLAGGRLDIVAPTTLAVDPLAGLVGVFRRRHPAIDIVIVEPPDVPATAEMVRTGECEPGLADKKWGGKAVEALRVYRQEILVAVPRREPFPPGRAGGARRGGPARPGGDGARHRHPRADGPGAGRRGDEQPPAGGGRSHRHRGNNRNPAPREGASAH